MPLWRWTLFRLTRPDAPGATDPATVPWELRPPWERCTTEEEWILSLEFLTLLDGLVSYLATVVGDRAPEARREIARDRNERYVHDNHPVLVSGTGQNHDVVPGIPVVAARADLRRIRKPADDRIAAYAQAVIDELAHARSAEVDRLLGELRSEDGAEEVLRDDRDLVLVRAPSWSADAHGTGMNLDETSGIP